MPGLGLRHHGRFTLSSARIVTGQGQFVFEVGKFLRIDEHGSGLAVVGDRRALPRGRSFAHQGTEMAASLCH